MSQDLICIVCPRGCRLHVDDELNVTGNFCPRGVTYGKQEVVNPTRFIASTMTVVNSKFRRVPVSVNRAKKKKKIFAVMEEIKKIQVSPPIHIGDVLISNVADSGADVVATKHILE